MMMKCLIFMVLALLVNGYSAVAQLHKKREQVKGGKLKVIFPPPVIFESDPYPISIDSLNTDIHEPVIVTGKVCAIEIKKNQTLLRLGSAFPYQKLTVVLQDAECRRVAKNLKYKAVSVTGRLFSDNDRSDGKPIMYINLPYLLKVVRTSSN